MYEHPLTGKTAGDGIISDRLHDHDHEWRKEGTGDDPSERRPTGVTDHTSQTRPLPRPRTSARFISVLFPQPNHHLDCRMADIPPASAPATSSHSSICAEPFLPTAPSFPALGSTFPTLLAFKLAATQASVPNKLLVSTHRPGIKMSLECALTGRKRKQRGGGDRMGENAGCGFMVVCELVDQKGNPVGKAGKGTAEFKVTQNTPHNHQAPVATNNGVGRRECMQLVKGEADGAVGAVASRRKQWDRTERDREVLADSVEYKLFARELGLTAEEVKEMVCWQIPVPRATTRSRARPSSTTAQPSDHKSGVGPSLGPATFPTCVAVAKPITQHTLSAVPYSLFPSYLDTLAEVALSDEAGPAGSHRRSISPFGLDKGVPSPPPSVIHDGQDDLVSPSTTFRRECFTTQATFNNADLPSPPRSAPAQSPRSSESDLAAQLPAPSLAPVATRPTLAIHPTALESDSPSPTATHHSSITSGKRKLVLQVKISALRQRGLSTKRPKQEHCDEDVKPFATAHASAAGEMDERELVKRLMSKFIGNSIESAIE